MWYFSGGDGPFYFKEQIDALLWLPQLVDPSKGFGESLLPRLWLEYPFRLIVKLLSELSLPWFIIDKILWLAPVIIGLYASFRLGRHFFEKKTMALVSSLIYMTNTYVLMVFGGGQLGLFWAYAVMPVVLHSFIVSDGSYRQGLVRGFLFSLLVLLDIRIAVVAGVIAVLYFFLFAFQNKKHRKQSIATYIIIPAIVTALIHSYWLLPVFFSGSVFGEVSDVYTASGMAKFLSFSDFSHAFSLLHPNWPENLFGKVYFLEPGFLLIPLTAFTALLFLVSKKTTSASLVRKKTVLFFSALALTGAFLAKGANEPFGGIYLWLFDHVPGFIMFRDPTKFYMLTAISYAILIPYVLEETAHWICEKGLRMKNARDKRRHMIFHLLSFVFIVFWCYTLRPLWTGQLTGNFTPKEIPNDYIAFKDMLMKDGSFSRTLFLPKRDAFAYGSDLHPLLDADMIFKESSVSGITRELHNSDSINTLSENGVKYIVVPIDVYGKIFLDDYRFSPELRDSIVDVLQALPLKRVEQFSQLAVFEHIVVETMEKPVYETGQSTDWGKKGVFVSLGSMLLCCFLLVYFRRKQL